MVLNEFYNGIPWPDLLYHMEILCCMEEISIVTVSVHGLYLLVNKSHQSYYDIYILIVINQLVQTIHFLIGVSQLVVVK